MTTLTIVPLYVAVFGLLFVPITLRVALYRRSNRISLGDGGDKRLLALIRGQGNFIETVPLALLLLILVELGGATPALVHGLALLLVAARVIHYLQVTGTFKPLAFRIAGMIGTITVYVVTSVWLLLAAA